MDAYLLDWANLLLRWAHVIVAIAWIGSSFAAEERGAAHAGAAEAACAGGVPAGGRVLKVMPLNNATQITEAERALIRRWFEAFTVARPAP